MEKKFENRKFEQLEFCIFFRDKGDTRNSATSLCEDILRTSGPSFILCNRFIDVNRYEQIITRNVIPSKTIKTYKIRINLNL